MTKDVIKTLDKKAIKILVKAFLEYKKAEAKFKELKDQFTKDLADGTYKSEYGSVNKTSYESKRLDIEKLKAEHPEIDFEEYMKISEVVTTKINPY